VPGDKSISHRSLILGALAEGETRITGLLEGEDVLNTGRAVAAMGAGVEKTADGAWTVRGAKLRSPAMPLDLGNSGTGCRLLMGLAAGQAGMSARFTGDASLSRRPMNRVAGPLRDMGAVIDTAEGGRLPLTVTAADPVRAITFRQQVASAQVKSAILLAGLGASGETVVIEPEPTRDHSERMLRHFGADLTVTPEPGGGNRITLRGPARLKAAPFAVPADPSSAAFPMVAALIVPGSEVFLPGLCLNPGRIGLLETLREMGADIAVENAREEGGEPVGDLRIRASALHGVEVPAARAPSMIDEYPALAMAAAFASGTTRMNGLGELRVKESDRLALVEAGLNACGVATRSGPDWLEVTGGKAIAGGARIVTGYDHRIAMSFLVLGLAAENPVTVEDAESIATSFPGFVALMAGLGADIGG
jgi:3-phosphoshikimate 1-carboxyvinyltransferase